MLEILDRGALAQELGVGDDSEVCLRALLADDALDLVTGAHRHRRLGHHDGEAGERRGDLARRGGNVAEIGVAVTAPGRRADRDEDGIGLCNGFCQVCGEIEAASAHVGFDKPVKAGLVDRNLVLPERRDLGSILVDARDVMAKIRETRAGDQPDISCSDHGNAHNIPLRCRFPPTPNGQALPPD